MRIALVSPYSWTYPGGVTRHIEALAAELRAMGHDARIIAPYDPDDRLARATHGGARPQRRPAPDHLVALGRTVGISANGAVSNIAFSPESILALRRELRDGYDVAHIHEPIAPMISTEALTAGPLPLVGTFHCHSENPLTNNFANALGARRKFNRLHVRIAVSDAAAWTARRFFGGHYRIIPNGVETGRGPAAQLDGPAQVDCGRARGGPLRILFVGQAVERKGLPVLLRAFEALRDQVPATLTLVGAGAEEIAPLLLDDAGVRALGKLSEARKLEELGRADLLCAPSLGGESFGMVLTEAFAGGTPVVASDIAGYRDVVRDGVDGLLVAPGDPLALAEALRELALDPARRARMAGSARAQAEQFAWPRVAAQVLGAYEDAIAVPQPAGRVARAAVRYGLSPADLKPRVPARPQPPLDRSEAPPRRRRAAHIAGQVLRVGVSLAALAVAYLALQRIGVTRVAASLLASSPGLVAAAIAGMCVAMVARGLAWHAILRAAPTWRRASRGDALQGTFIGVLMSSTLPARLGEPSRALIVARRLGRAWETLPVVLGTMVSQSLLNLLALTILGGVMLSSVGELHSHLPALLAVALAPVAALAAVLIAPALTEDGGHARAGGLGRLRALGAEARGALGSVRRGLRVFADPRAASVAMLAQLGAWGLQLVSCWLLLVALGLDRRAGVGVGAAAGVLFAVNVTAIVPVTPANVGVFQAACVAVLAGAYHVPTADALAYGIVLQAVEVATALIMGMPALVNEGLSWREMRVRTMHAAPVRLPALPPRTTG